MSDANNSASEVCQVTTKVTSSDVASSEKLEHSGERYEYVQVKKKFKKQNNKEVKDILLTNKFESLEDEPVFLSKLEVPEAEARNEKSIHNKSTNKSDLVEESHKKKSGCCLSDTVSDANNSWKYLLICRHESLS